MEVVDRGGHVAGVPDLDGVDEDLEAEGVAAVVVFVGGQLGARADDEVAPQGVERFALVELPEDSAAHREVGAVGEEEVGAYDPPTPTVALAGSLRSRSVSTGTSAATSTRSYSWEGTDDAGTETPAYRRDRDAERAGCNAGLRPQGASPARNRPRTASVATNT